MDMGSIEEGIRQEEPRFGCLFCRSGNEDKVLMELKVLHPEIESFVPKKLRYRRHGGKAEEERVTLFPGYIFFRASGDVSLRDVLRRDQFFRLLDYGEKDWRLTGADELIARRLYEAGGTIGFSKAFYERDRIRILDGFLKEYEGRITRVNHRARTAEITLEIQGKTVRTWLGFELIEPVGDGKNVGQEIQEQTKTEETKIQDGENL